MMSALQRHSLSFGRDAFQIFNAFKDQPHVFFLDSSLRKGNGAFSYIGFDPFLTVSGGDLPGLRKAFDKYRSAPKGLSFPAGAVGYLGYDGALFFGFYDAVLAVDHRNKRLIISGYSKSRIKDIIKRLKDPVSAPAYKPKEAKRPFNSDGLSFKSNFTKTEYMQAVRQALQHIRRGDIYQINLSHRIKVSVPGGRSFLDPAAVYGNLRREFPSEFGAYFDDGRRVVLSASPERFLRLQGRRVQVKPMKGTSPRGRTALEDRLSRERLRKNPKEIAELLMVTDLERNDLGRVCDYRTVKVKAMRTIESYSAVFQATSTVEGRLRRGQDQFDLLQAAFPSGSVTGCPKIEAMKIIEKLERCPRGLYTGALGYMSFSGDMDFNVMIRTVFLEKNAVTFHVGGGIVADSDPQAEWQETWDKAGPLMEALKRSLV